MSSVIGDSARHIRHCPITGGAGGAGSGIIGCGTSTAAAAAAELLTTDAAVGGAAAGEVEGAGGTRPAAGRPEGAPCNETGGSLGAAFQGGSQAWRVATEGNRGNPGRRSASHRWHGRGGNRRRAPCGGKSGTRSRSAGRGCLTRHWRTLSRRIRGCAMVWGGGGGNQRSGIGSSWSGPRCSISIDGTVSAQRGPGA